MARAPRFASRLSLSATYLLHRLFGAVFLVHAVAEPRGAVHAAHQVVVRHAREQVVAAAGEVPVVGPFLVLEVDIGLLLVPLEALEQVAEAEAVGVDRGQRDEQEAVAEPTELLEAQRIRVEVPLEGPRPVEREAGSR